MQLQFTSRWMLVTVLLLMIVIRLMVVTTPPTTQIGNLNKIQRFSNGSHGWVKQCNCIKGVSAAWGDTALRCQNCGKLWFEEVPQK